MKWSKRMSPDGLWATYTMEDLAGYPYVSLKDFGATRGRITVGVATSFVFTIPASWCSDVEQELNKWTQISVVRLDGPDPDIFPAYAAGYYRVCIRKTGDWRIAADLRVICAADVPDIEMRYVMGVRTYIFRKDAAILLPMSCVDANLMRSCLE